MTGSTTHIRTLHVRTLEAASAALLTRLRVAAQLSGADLRPPGLPPAAVLLVRSLPDPVPGQVAATSPTVRLDRSWERAVRSALADALHRAARPHRGRIPARAEAVLFQDVAEAWACWSRARIAHLRGSSELFWWMQDLQEAENRAVRRSSGASGLRLADGWAARPQRVPAILGFLAAWGDAIDVLRSMTAADADRILRAVCTAYDCVVPGSADSTQQDASKPAESGCEARGESAEAAERADLPLRPAVTRTALAERVSRRGQTTEDAARAPRRAASASRPAPWQAALRQAGGERLAAAAGQLDPTCQQLSGIALVLHRQPTLVRSPSFRMAWHAWREANGWGAGSPPVEETMEARARPDEATTEAESRGETRRALRVTPAAEDEASAPEPSPGPFPEARTDPEDPEEGSQAPRPALPAARSDHARRDGGYGRELGGDTAITELGGALYLLNLIEALGLPDGFTTPPLSDTVSPWAVLEALTRTLLGPDDEALRPSDALWRVLAGLDGRPPDALAGTVLDKVAAASNDPRAYRMPSAWLHAPHVDVPGVGRWAVRSGRVQVWTRRGCVADLRATDHPEHQATREWGRMATNTRLRRAERADAMPRWPDPDGCSPALARWAANAAPYVFDRLAAALGLDPASPGWIHDLIAGPATLSWTSTQVDLVRPLDSTRLDVRRAGLDRSPGWWGRAGRVIRFHFRETGRRSHEKREGGPAPHP